MTEAEWLGATTVTPLLDYVKGRGERRNRLIACGAVRLYLQRHWVTPADAREAAELLIAEKYADGLATDATLRFGQMLAARNAPFDWLVGENAGYAARRAIYSCFEVPGGRPDQRTGMALIRDIFGNPFRPVALAPAWRTDTAVALAGQMYETRDFSAMPILADALQDAGCDNEDIVAHCRGAQEGESAEESSVLTTPHVRGCWVVDQLLNHG